MFDERYKELKSKSCKPIMEAFKKIIQKNNSNILKFIENKEIIFSFEHFKKNTLEK